MMKAEWVYNCDEPDPVREYYDMLRTMGYSGELAMLLHRAHRNTARMSKYDDPKYLKFLDHRRNYAIQELISFVNIDRTQLGSRIYISWVLPPVGGADPGKDVDLWQVDTRECFAIFTFGTDGWQTSARNGQAIFAYCDALTGADRG